MQDVPAASVGLFDGLDAGATDSGQAPTPLPPAGAAAVPPARPAQAQSVNATGPGEAPPPPRPVAVTTRNATADVSDWSDDPEAAEARWLWKEGKALQRDGLAATPDEPRMREWRARLVAYEMRESTRERAGADASQTRQDARETRPGSEHAF